MTKSVRLFGTAADSIVDGPGLRYAVFVQGCTHCCPGCHNPKSQPADGGDERLIDDLLEEISANKIITGVTLSGGEPFQQAEACVEIARRCHDLGLNVWAYTGYLYEDLLKGVQGQAGCELLDCVDVLVDGPFVKDLKSYQLKWKGSSNQRVIDMNETRRQGKVVLYGKVEDFPSKPASW